MQTIYIFNCNNKILNSESYGVIYKGYYRKNPKKIFCFKFFIWTQIKKNKNENHTYKEIKFQKQLKHNII